MKQDFVCWRCSPGACPGWDGGDLQEEMSMRGVCPVGSTGDKVQRQSRAGGACCGLCKGSGALGVCPDLCHQGFFGSTGELIAEGLVTSNRSTFYLVSARREECGDAVSDEPHFIFCPPSSKTIEITEGQDPAL